MVINKLELWYGIHSYGTPVEYRRHLQASCMMANFIMAALTIIWKATTNSILLVIESDASMSCYIIMLRRWCKATQRNAIRYREMQYHNLSTNYCIINMSKLYLPRLLTEMYPSDMHVFFKTLKPKRNVPHFVVITFEWILLKENYNEHLIIITTMSMTRYIVVIFQEVEEHSGVQITWKMARGPLTHCGRVTRKCVSKLCYHWFR